MEESNVTLNSPFQFILFPPCDERQGEGDSYIKGQHKIVSGKIKVSLILCNIWTTSDFMAFKDQWGK